MRSLKDILKPSVHALALPTSIWAITIISITSCIHVIRPPEAAASALVPILETKIFVQGGERPGLEHAQCGVLEAGEAILRLVNGAKVGATCSASASKAQRSR